MQRVVLSVINLIVQTQGTGLPSESQTTKFTLTPFHTLNNTIQHIQMRLRTGGTIHTVPQYSKLDKTNALKPVLSTRGLENQVTFLLGARPPEFWLPLRQLSPNGSQTST